MNSLPLTEVQANRIIETPKRISNDIRWAYNPAHNQTWARFECDVQNEINLGLTLYGSTQLMVVGKSSFCLVLNGAFRVFGLDVNGSHSNKHTNRDVWRAQTHKQRWTDQCRNAFAYTPDESIPIEANDAFLEFCQECGIQFDGRIGEVPPYQSSLE